jgi:3-oxoacyl-[acyl-carrier-protein] synthase-3
MTYLERIGVFLPESSASVQDLSEALALSRNQVSFLTRYLGLDRIAIAPDLDLADMLTAAGADALRDADRDSVRFLIHAHTMQHVATASKSMLCDVRTALGLRNAVVFSMSHMNCVVGLHALQVARALLQSAQPGDKVLLLTGDKIVSDTQRIIPDTTLLGEAAAAALIGQDATGDRVVGRALTVLGRFYQCLHWPEELRLEYKKIYVENLRNVMQAAIADAGRQPGDIDIILPHNVNRLTWKGISRDLGIPMERVYLDNIPKFGHCYASDPFINLASVRDTGLVKAGDLVLLVSAGLGAAFAATLVQIGERRGR